MKIIQDKWISKEILRIDGTHFIDCILTECVLQYGGGHVVMERTRVKGCHHVFLGSARLTLNYLEAMELIPPNPLTVDWSDEVIH